MLAILNIVVRFLIITASVFSSSALVEDFKLWTSSLFKNVTSPAGCSSLKQWVWLYFYLHLLFLKEEKLWTPLLVLFFQRCLFAPYLTQIPPNFRYVDCLLFSSTLVDFFSIELSFSQFQAHSGRRLLLLTFTFMLFVLKKMISFNFSTNFISGVLLIMKHVGVTKRW